LGNIEVEILKKWVARGQKEKESDIEQQQLATNEEDNFDDASPASRKL
jgi:hypothetical protein